MSMWLNLAVSADQLTKLKHVMSMWQIVSLHEGLIKLHTQSVQTGLVIIIMLAFKPVQTGLYYYAPSAA